MGYGIRLFGARVQDAYVYAMESRLSEAASFQQIFYLLFCPGVASKASALSAAYCVRSCSQEKHIEALQ